MIAITNTKIVTEGKIIKDKNVIFNDKILEITESLPVDAKIIDGNGLYLSSGFIDQHIHGAFGKDAMDGSIHSLEEISKSIISCGVTSFLPTTMTMGFLNIKSALDSIKSYKGREKGAKIIGAHLEGPFINEKYKGAQDNKYINKPNIDLIKQYLDIIKLITYAPELDDGLRFTSDILEYKNIVLSIGHSNCDMDLAIRLYDLGVKNITHCFNAMNSFHHRSPGIIGALFVKNFNVEYIADGIHSDLRMLRGFINKIGKSKAILVSDAMRASLLSTGEFDLGGQLVIVDKDSAKLKDGTLAGSILRINQAVRNVISETISMPEAIQMVTENPAKSLGLYDVIGSIAVGKNADLVLFDEEINISQVYINGKKLFEEKIHD